ncbi:MAG: enolase C-terminal domain-like protein [Saprospiraceae bacterium]
MGTESRFRHHADVACAHRCHLPSGCQYRLTAAQTIAYSKELKTLGVEFIEQPESGCLGRPQGSPLRKPFTYYCRRKLPRESDVAQLWIFDGINIKLVKCGGLTPARRMIQQARALRLKVMMGCMTESSVEFSAIAHIAPPCSTMWIWTARCSWPKTCTRRSH